MGILKNIFSERSESSKPRLHWIPLTSISQLDAIASSKKTAGIFKHSTRCGTSMMAKRRFESDFDLELDEIDMYYLDVLSYREISNQLASDYNVWHESPQLLIIKNGELKIKTIEDVPMTPHIQTLEVELEAIEKGGYEHFMLKEIFEQPKSIGDCL